ncbi:D-2-hydroxyacid dehydrogenase [Acidobacteria bacterium AH-259-G07]|nr:D-2-hydroxyacid dehydrogenase [Acidobacteria bacterium AH-259-G07]
MKFSKLIVVVFLGAVFTLAARAHGVADGQSIVVTGLTPDQVKELRAAVPGARLITAHGKDVPQKVPEADALIGTCNVEAIRAGKSLRWVQVFSAGVERCMFPELVNSDIVLTNAKIIQGPEIADHAMGLLLSMTRSLHRQIPNKAKQEWTRDQYTREGIHKPSGERMIELRGKTALIIGLGGIGTQVAQRAAGFDMRILAVDPKDIPFMKSVERVAKPDQLSQLLPQADVVFMCAPHTAQTEGMLGAKEFALMKPGAYFINVSRGKTVQTAALVEALKGGHLAGAGLDVTDPEPLPKGHPLWSLDNVVITPHLAGRSDQVWRRRIELFKENMRRFVEGLPLLHVVDKNKGY